MFFYGMRASKIANFDVHNSKCAHCNEMSSQNVSVFGRYAHIFWIPIIPLGKKVVSECNNCKKTIGRKEFSPKLEELFLEKKDQAKRPIWHWIAPAILALLIALVGVAVATSEPDPRAELLSAEMKMMESNPTMESDSISYKLKSLFDNFANEEIDPSEFEYLTKIKGDKALVLVKIPNLKHVEKEARTEAIEMIEMITDSQADLEGKEKFIGVHGAFSWMLTKTSNNEQNSRLASTSDLLDFYGPKTASAE